MCALSSPLRARFRAGHGGAQGPAGACRDTNNTSDSPDRKYHSHSLRFCENFFSKILIPAFPPALQTNGILLVLAIFLREEKAKPPLWPQTHHHLARLSLRYFWLFSSKLLISQRKRPQLPSLRGNLDGNLGRKGATAFASWLGTMYPSRLGQAQPSELEQQPCVLV